MSEKFELGQTVQWYKNGWRFGRFVRTDGHDAIIKQGTKEVKIPLVEVEFYDSGTDSSKK